MPEQRRSRSFNRILVALDASRSSLSALEAASMLAEAMRCELEGLFVEDADLFTLATLPFSREVRTQSGTIHSMNLDNLEKELQACMAAARRAMQQAAGQRKLRWRFRCVRGNVHSEVTAAAAKVDILCIGRQGQSLFRRSRPGGTVHVALQGRAPVLIADDLSNYLNAPIAVIFDETEGASNRVRLGAEIAQRTGNDLVILVLVSAKSTDVSKARQRLETHLPSNLAVSYQPVDLADTATLPQTARPRQFGLIISGAKPDASIPVWLDHMVTAAGCPLLLVPDPAAAPDAPRESGG